MGFKTVENKSKHRNEELNSVFCIRNMQFLHKLIYIAPKTWKETLVSHCVSLFYVFDFSIFPALVWVCYFIFARASNGSMS